MVVSRIERIEAQRRQWFDGDHKEDSTFTHADNHAVVFKAKSVLHETRSLPAIDFVMDSDHAKPEHHDWHDSTSHTTSYARQQQADIQVANDAVMVEATKSAILRLVRWPHLML